MPTTTPFNNLITFSRGSNATVTGSNGLIQWAPNNLLLQSESFDSSAWFKGNTTVTANAAVAPDGSTTADQIAFAAVANANIQPNPAVTVTAGLTYTFSVYVRASAAVSNVNLSLQGSDTLVSIGTDWTRVSMTVTASGGTLSPTLVTRNSVASTIFAWGAQLELGSTATTYNPTTVKNLLGFSEAFDNAAWAKTRASIVTGAQANPINGLFNAQKLMEDTAAGTHILSRSVTASASIYNYSIYAKAAERSVIRIRDSVNSVDGYFNLATGVASNAVNATLSIVAIGSGWYRCSVTSTATVTNPEFGVRLASAVGTDSYAGDGNSGVYIYGAQLSDSASLDPYVPTPGAAPSSTAFYGPRFDFDPVTLQPRGLLVEEQRTNLTLQSEAITSSPWTFYNGSNGAAIAAITSPSGAVNGIGLNDTSGSGYYGVTQTVNISTTTTYTFTTYVKQGTNTTGFSVWLIGNNSNTYYQNTIAWTGGVPTGAGWTATNVGNGWYRISYTFASLTSTNVAIYLLPCPTVLADTGSTYFWGAQLEVGAFATSYIPTVASTVTRSADVATITGQNFGQWFGAAEGTFVVNASTAATSAGNPSVYAASDNSVNERYQLFGSSSNWRAVCTDGGAAQADLTVAGFAQNVTFADAFAYKVNDFAMSLNGSAVVTDAAGTLPTVDRFILGNGSSGSGNALNGHIRNIRFIPARAADFQLQGLST